METLRALLGAEARPDGRKTRIEVEEAERQRRRDPALTSLN